MGIIDEADLVEQQQELEALQSIFEDALTVLDEAPIVLELAISLNLGGHRTVTVRFGFQAPPLTKISHAAEAPKGTDAFGGVWGAATPSNADVKRDCVPEALRYAEELLEQRGCSLDVQSGGNFATISVQHLPPLRLVATFCHGYPSTCAPAFQLASKWLSKSQLAPLCIELDVLAAEHLGSAVIFTWADWLQNNALAHLGLDGSAPISIASAVAAVPDSRALSELPDPIDDLVQELGSFDMERSWWEWQQTAHLCNICFSEKPGTTFVKLGGCGHTFCSECCAEMMRVHIAEGSVASIRCPWPDCRDGVAPGVVRQLASDEDYQRWKRLELQKIITNIKGIAFCPRCENNGKETPVLPACDADEDPEAVPLMHCDVCDYLFCAACREAYHPSSRCTAHIHRLEKLGFKVSSVVLTLPDGNACWKSWSL